MIPLFKVFMPETVLEPLKKTLFSGFIGQGPKVDEFEKVLGEWIGNPLVLTLNSGTSALQLALRLANVGYGDEVLTSPMTCMATNVPILAMGAKPVWVDIDPYTGNIDPEDIKRKISPKTKAIMVVHWGGYPCDLDEINLIAKQYEIPVIEDAAHAFGAIYHGKKIGNHSDFICFSFQAIKHITTVDGGALVCKRKEDYRRGKLLRWYGIDREGPRKDMRCEEDVKEFGYKFHMNDVTATIGIEQMKYIDKILETYRSNARYYDEHLYTVPCVEPLRYKKDRLSAYWLYTILVDNKPEFIEKMNSAGIQVSSVHARNDKHSLFKDIQTELPGVTEFWRRMVSIPVGWWVTEEDRERIVQEVHKNVAK
jgi:dTDP-4-amino-4,6-dideoxygalactose transaminase